MAPYDRRIPQLNALQTTSAPLLKKLGCHYFQYLKVFQDGSFSFMTTQPKWDEFTIRLLEKTNKPAVYSHIDSHTLEKNKYIFLWDPNLPKYPVKLAREFDITNGMTFVERHEDFYYMFAFAAPASQSSIIDKYFNSLDDMNEFIQNFKYQQRRLISDIDKNRYHVALHRQDNNLEKMLLAPKQTRNIFLNNSHLTPQELACIKELAKGLTYKEIANKLNISHRTVETYLNRVRQRFNLHYKKDLITLVRNFY